MDALVTLLTNRRAWPILEVDERVALDPGPLVWPTSGVNAFAAGINRDYMDLRKATWQDAIEATQLEQGLFVELEGQLLAGRTFEEALSLAEDDFLQEDIEGLDFGISAAVLTLNAMGFPTIYSCSGHGTSYPFVSFWCRKVQVPLFIDVATSAKIGLINGNDGCVEVFSDDFRGLLRFALTIQPRRNEFQRSR